MSYQVDCPFCKGLCDAEFVDIGIGEQQVTPFVCEACHAYQWNTYTKPEFALTELEYALSWVNPAWHPEVFERPTEEEALAPFDTSPGDQTISP